MTKLSSRAILFLFLLLAGLGLAASASAANCNFKWNSVCYEFLDEAELAMRNTDVQHELLKYVSEDDDYVYYELKDMPQLPAISWQGQYIWNGQNPSWGPLFATYNEALSFVRDKAARPSKKYPTQIISDDLVLRGERTISGKDYEYFSHNYLAMPVSYIDITDYTYYAYCSYYSAGTEDQKIGGATHFTYASDANTPSTVLPDFHILLFNNCYQGGGVWYRVQGFRVLQVRETTGSCPSGYTLNGSTCESTLSKQIEKVQGFALQPPSQCTMCPRNNESNPINPADGTKSETEVDYASSAAGGLSFSRYYNSTGAYRTANENATGWRHTYSRELNEQPDKSPAIQFASSTDQSDVYTTASAACTSGWGDIKADVWGGDLSTGTASFANGNTCEISVGGSVKANFDIRSTVAWTGFTPSSTVKTITRPNGISHRFVQSGSDWINELDASVKLEASGSNWIFTDRNDTQETYNSSGQLTSIELRNGQVQALTYDLTAAQGGDDDSDTLDKVVGEFGHTITFSYNDEARLESITTPDGQIDYGYDIHRNLTSVTYPDDSMRDYLYEDYSLPSYLTGLVDENGDRFASWDYDSVGRAILSERGSGKESVEFTYNTSGTTTVDLGNGASRTYTFDVEQGSRVVSDLSGDVCSSCPGGEIDSRTYDSNGFLDEATDWNGNITKTARNSEGLITTLTEADGSLVERETTMTWHSTYRLPTQVGTSINDTDYTYDTDGNATEIEITDGTYSRTWTMTYNSDGQVLTVNGPHSGATDTTTFDYYTCSTGDECGQLESITNALSQVTDFDSYDESGRLTQMTDMNGLETDFTYDSRGNLLTVVQTPTVGTARTTTMTYDDASQLATVALPNELELTYTYDAAHYLSSVTDNLGNYINYDYDAMGNLEDEDTYDPLDTLSRANDYVSDLNNRLETVTNGGFDTDLVFDDVGNLTDVTEPDLTVTQHEYDALNRLEETLDALSGYTDFAYDAHDNLTQVSAPNGAVTDYTYDNLDNLTEEDSPDRGVITYTHDAAGNVASMTDARSKVTDYTYDALNRLTEIELHNNDTITFQYDTGTYAKGHLNKITDPSGETSWTYNQFGQVTAKTQKIGTISLTTEYEYDTKGRLVTMTYPSGKDVDYTYDDHLPDGVSVDTTTILSGATYDPFGPVNAWTWGNTTVHSRSFNTRGLLTSQKMVTDTRTLTYDDNGQVITLDDARHDLGFDYNALGQLDDFTAAGSSALTGQDFTYDENGNRESIVESSTTYNYTVTTNTNRLASTQGPTAKTNTYDASGNITNDNIHTYVYDDRGRLVSVDSGSVTYEHNGQRQRVKKDDGTNETLYVYDEVGQLIGEYDDAGTAILEHVWFNDAPVAVLDGTDEYYVHTDHLGTPRIITDGNTIVWRWESGPFGEDAAQEDPDGDSTDFTYNLRFPGQYYDDETGFHYNYFRTYDPSTGRYLESDPIGLEGGLNTYGYVGGNPLSYIDPTGESGILLPISGAIGRECLKSGVCVGTVGALTGASLACLIHPDLCSAIITEACADVNDVIDGLLKPYLNEEKKLTPGEIKKLKGAGIDPEQLKGGKATGKLDLYKDKKGNIKIKPKDGSGPGEDTGININEL